MTEPITREFEHVRRRDAAYRPRPIRVLQLTLPIARVLGLAADPGWPWPEHRSMAEVMREEGDQS